MASQQELHYCRRYSKMSVNKAWGRYVEYLCVISKNNENVRINLKTQLILLPVFLSSLKRKTKEQRDNKGNKEIADERKEER
jgi:hypothetical protein